MKKVRLLRHPKPLKKSFPDIKKKTKNRLIKHTVKIIRAGFPGGAVVGSPPANAGDTGSCPGPGN